MEKKFDILKMEKLKHKKILKMVKEMEKENIIMKMENWHL